MKSFAIGDHWSNTVTTRALILLVYFLINRDAASVFLNAGDLIA